MKVKDNCQLCTGDEFKASWYAESETELAAEYAVTDDSKFIITLSNTNEKYLGFIDVDISYCPECGRKLEE